MSNWRDRDRRQRERREASDHRNSAVTRTWDDLHAPVRVLVLLLIALVLLTLYHDAEYLLTRVFGVLLLFLFAAIVAMLVNLLVDRLTRVSAIRRGMAVLLVNLLILGVLALLGAVLAPALASQAAALGEQAPALATKFNDTLSWAQAGLNARGIPLHLGVPTGLEALVAPILGSALQVVTGAIGAVIDVLLVAVIAIYMQLQGRGMVAALRQVFPRQQQLFDFTLATAGSTLAGYVRGQVILAAVMAVYTGLVLSAIGVHFALVIAFITFLLELVPLIGAPVAMLLAIVFALLQGPTVVLVVATATIVGHIGFAYTVGLKLIGDATRVHPLVAMAALLLGSQVGGILGALFAIPIAGMINVFLGALLRSRRGQEAFSMSRRSGSESALDTLPSLGEEISQLASEERTVEKPSRAGPEGGS